MALDFETPDKPMFVYADERVLKQILLNLISNAVKFSASVSAPTVSITADELGDMVRCVVQDNGIGIPESYHENIFGLFNRLHPEIEGTGVGLALVKRIVEAHGGTIRVESAGEGCGATFIVMLPGTPETP